jgi:hypothetical protein
MADKVPIRTVYDSSNNATGLAEFQTGETVGYAHGGTGLAALGTAGQILRVNSGASAIEFGDGFSASTITLDSAGDINLDAGGADIILKDDGTEFGRFTNSSGQLVIKSSSSTTTALTMSGANVTVAGNLTVTGNATASGSTITLGDAAGDTVAFGGTITGNLVFEGSSADSFETTLAPGNPSADITLTMPSSASDTLVGKATTDTLTNKTLTTPTITTPIINTGGALKNGSSSAGYLDFYEDSDNGTNYVRVIGPASTATVTLTLPAATDTLVGLATTDTLTNKTLTTPTIAEIDGSTITLDSAGDITLDAGGADIVLKDDGTEFGRFTNSSGELVIKSSSSATTALTFSGASATLAGNLTVTGTTTFNGGTITLGDAATDTVAFGGTITGNLVFEGSTADSFETTLTPGNPSSDIALTLPSSASDTLVGLVSTQTLTNKTLTSPTITTPTITEIDSGSTITLDATTDIILDADGDNITMKAAGTTALDFVLNGATDITLDAPGDIKIDADGGDIILLDAGTQYGSLTNTGGNLIIKSGSTTAATFSGANVTLAGTVASGAITSSSTLQGTALTLTSGSITFEGSTADSFETILAVTDPTADRTLTLPNKTATLATTVDVFFANSTTTTHPAASGNVDLADGETPFESITDAFGVTSGTVYSQMDPRGSTVTVDLGSVA